MKVIYFIIIAFMIFVATNCSISSKSTLRSEDPSERKFQFTGIMEEISWNPAENPNPFCPDNWFAFHLEDSQNVCIQHYDKNKNFVSELYKGKLEAGNYKFTVMVVEGTNQLAAGTIYFLKITIGEETRMQKRVLLK